MIIMIYIKDATIDCLRRKSEMARGIAERMAELISDRKMTQKDLASLSGVTESAISHYLEGDRIPRGATLIKIANALDTTTDYLLGQNEEVNEQDFEAVRVILARNASAMTKDQKMKLINLLM